MSSVSRNRSPFSTQPLHSTPSNESRMLGTKTLDFPNDQELIKFGVQTLQQATDPDELICSEAVTLDRSSLKNSPGKPKVWLMSPLDSAILSQIEDAYGFCCSFYD